MRNLITVATQSELELLKDRKQFNGIPVLITGVGPLNIIRALSGISKDTQIINMGYAGSADLEIGKDYYIGSVELLHRVPFESPMFQLGYGVKCYTSADFVTQAHEKGCLYDMELAYICALGFQVRAIKRVSDHCNYSEYENAIK